MALSTIENLKTSLQVGARPNLFRVNLVWPSAIASLKTVADGSADRINLLCKSAAIPGMTIGVIEVPFMGGRRVKVPGDRTFGDWTVTFISDNAHNVRAALLLWMDFMSDSNFDNDVSLRSNATVPSAPLVGLNYTEDMTVKQLAQSGDPVRTYKLYQAFPTDVGAIDLSYDSTDTISEFTVTFQYHWMNATQGDSDPGDEEVLDENTLA